MGFRRRTGKPESEHRGHRRDGHGRPVPGGHRRVLSLLLVGADTVFRDGTLCNKIGTRALAETAAEHEVPTIVACEVIKLAPIESTEAGELPREVRELVDLTPPELVHAVVTEEGSVGSDEVQALVDRTPFLREGYALLGRTP